MTEGSESKQEGWNGNCERPKTRRDPFFSSDERLLEEA
jgi:hypothetical protein